VPLYRSNGQAIKGEKKAFKQVLFDKMFSKLLLKTHFG